MDGHVNNVDDHAAPGAIREERDKTLTLEWRFYQSAAKTQTTCSETSGEERRGEQQRSGAQVTHGLDEAYSLHLSR